ncbi:MAG: ATP-binding cassette domain-containing protein [Alphaproteobacteria bacterium]|nr:ATP-binding cassette domain-containing protein [Alphaproteobacteria bacterium]
MIQLIHITAGYGDKVVIRDITTAFDPSKITVIMGPNGCGKTTLLKTIMGLIKPMSGEILVGACRARPGVCNTPLQKFAPSPMEWINHDVFMIGQGARVFPNMSVRDNIEIATHYWPDRTEFPARLDAVLKHFPDLRGRLDDMAGNLSGGQQQMVALARGLINRPKLLLLDEPSIGLSPKLIGDTFRKLHEINKKTGTGFVIVEHNLKTLLPLTDNAIILSHGRIAYDGASDGKTLAKMLGKIF